MLCRAKRKALARAKNSAGMKILIPCLRDGSKKDGRHRAAVNPTDFFGGLSHLYRVLGERTMRGTLRVPYSLTTEANVPASFIGAACLTPSRLFIPEDFENSGAGYALKLDLDKSGGVGFEEVDLPPSIVWDFDFDREITQLVSIVGELLCRAKRVYIHADIGSRRAFHQVLQLIELI